ncbi:DUF1499 domain-containing protein [Hoeflea olei]|uniref:DUF1499 domain-containing protein n=1 Tax=Hoeflea olei TaxID=1480615 RepID=A0A1C1YV09_9HYPH|nr:DUF1499 domain-containing protein [Hoeflea olei]OCW57289.1 hypothetical protein AWJ14_14010 [Hoeflea olei]
MIKTLVLGALGIIAIAAVAFVLIGRERSWELIAGSPDTGPRDFSTDGRSSSPNDALACSPGLCNAPDFEIAPVDETPEAAIARLADRLTSIDKLAHRVDDGSDPRKARFVTYSPTMRFPDVIHLEATPLDDGRTGLMAYAAAQLGKSDLGKNRGRLEALFARP